MKIEVLRTILLKDNPRESRLVSKAYNWSMVPRIGETIWTTAFHRDEEVKVLEVSHSLDTNDIQVWLSPLEIESSEREHLKRMVDLYVDTHNWECGFYGF